MQHSAPLRTLAFGLALCVPLAASAQTQLPGAIVTAPRLSGYWSVTGPNLIQLKAGPLVGIRIIYSGETDSRDICLLRHTDNGLSATCSAGLSSIAEGGIAGDHVNLRWWSGPANLIFDGDWDQKATIDGEFSGGLAGVRVTGHIPASLHKLILPAAPPSPASLAAARNVLDDLRQGALTTGRYEPGAVKRVWRAEAWPYAKTQPQQLTYLGAIHVHWQQHQPDLLEDVYEVRSDGNVSLCRVNLSARGLVDDFACHEDTPPPPPG